ncbi:MAG: type II toxin-antitoxin system ParD family antitoxin [Candidatus Dadabacteria bacterium]|nr:type II toxin-antitoxin system ParD family antitoxin [Candidatus Dadabacteria bacterium]NIX14997.1 type II toxin-antitoxin system ParD family antitoxin [Candidatus Dadabacteria bacterium]
MNISFTEKQQKYIAEQIKSGDYQNASEVVRDALRMHEIYRRKVIEDLRAEIDKGWNASVSSRSVKDIIREKQSV